MAEVAGAGGRVGPAGRTRAAASEGAAGDRWQGRRRGVASTRGARGQEQGRGWRGVAAAVAGEQRGERVRGGRRAR